jgi:hypothetical protein
VYSIKPDLKTILSTTQIEKSETNGGVVCSTTEIVNPDAHYGKTKSFMTENLNKKKQQVYKKLAAQDRKQLKAESSLRF